MEAMRSDCGQRDSRFRVWQCNTTETSEGAARELQGPCRSLFLHSKSHAAPTEQWLHASPGFISSALVAIFDEFLNHL